MASKIRGAIAVSMLACALAACSSKESQQQKFIDAMNHGNAARADQIWLHMDEKSREQFARGQGMAPNVSPDDIKKQVMQHYQDEMNGKAANDTGETVERPAPNVNLGGLQSLPGYISKSDQMAQPTTVETGTLDAPSK